MLKNSSLCRYCAPHKKACQSASNPEPEPTAQHTQPHLRGVVPGGAGGAMAPPDFGKSVTLSQPGGTDYAHLFTTGTPGFSDLPTALHLSNRGVITKLID